MSVVTGELWPVMYNRSVGDHRRSLSSDELIRQAKEALNTPDSESGESPPEMRPLDPPDEAGLSVTRRDQRTASVTRRERRPSSRSLSPTAESTPDFAHRRSRALLVALTGVLLVGVAAFALLGSGRETSRDETSPSVQVTFRDDFEGQLAPGWGWVGEDSDRWSLTASSGELVIDQAPAGSTTPAAWTNVLLRPPNADAYEVTISLDFQPIANFQSAGLIVWEDDSNFLQLVRAFCDPCISEGGDGVYFDNVVDRGFPENQGPRPISTDDVVLLRVQVTGNTYVGSYSLDRGDTWEPAGTITRSLTSPRVGIVVNRNDPKAPVASFDFFELTS